MIDPANPCGAAPADRAPWSMIQKRIGDEKPYYETMGRVNEACYVQAIPTTLKLSVRDGVFTVYSNDKEVLAARDESYKGGKIGFTLMAQSGCFFDNVELVDFSVAFDPRSKVVTKWASLKK